MMVRGFFQALKPRRRGAGFTIGLCICLSAALAGRASAQLATQTALVGTVTDGSGAVVPGAAVVAVNIGTKDTYETTTNDQGYFNIQFVRTGKYEITVSLAGFQTYKTVGVDVGTNQVVRTDVSLQVSSVTDTVVVEASTPTIATDSAAVSETVNEKAIVELPLSGRNVWSLANTTPGVSGGPSSFVGAGQRSIQNSLSLDGINTAANLLTSTSMRPIADAVTEVQVQTGSTSAEYGSYLGVYVNVVTKSGTNDYHGALFEFYQNDALDARGYFENRANPANPRTFNQFGFQFDGPAGIPRLYDGRNKTFFMFAYEGIRQKTESTSLIAVPTERMRRGDFGEFTGTIRNPLTGQVYANNQIPQAALSPQALRALAFYPLPNLPGIGANLRANTSTTTDTDQVLTRVDQNLGNRVRIYGRYNWQDRAATTIGEIPVNGGINPQVNRNVLVAYTHTLTSTLLNDFRIGYHVVNDDTLNYFTTSGLLTAGSDLGIPGFDGDVRYDNPGIPNFAVTGYAGLGRGDTNWFQRDTTFQMANVLAWSRGSHNIRTGFDLRRLNTGRTAANEPRGLLTFNGQMTGFSVADLALGLPQQVRPPVLQLEGDVAGWRNGFFVNDNWQATNKITLSLGLRYELQLPVYTTTGLATMLNEDQTAIIPATTPQPGFQFHEPNRKDFAPRLGVAYRATPKTVVRAGWGIYYNPNQTNTFTFLTNNPPLSPSFLFTSQASNPTLTLDNPTGVATTNPRPNVITPNRHLPSAKKNQWSVDLQREIFADTALDLQYVGSRTSHLDRSFFNNTPLPGPGDVNSRRPNQLFGEIRTIQNDLIADYDAVSVILRRRLSHGLQATAHYTWSRTRDIATHSNSASGRTPNPYDTGADYGPADWDVPHRFVASYVYDLPFFRSSSQPIVKYALAGWQVGGITTIQSGTPINVTIQGDRANTTTTNQRPDLIGTPGADCGGGRLTGCLSADAFALPAMYTYGNAPRNLLRGPGRVITDLSLAKNVPIGAKMQVQLRGEAFNLFNTPNFNNPNAVFGAATFGSITGAQNMRQIQLGAKLLF